MLGKKSKFLPNRHYAIKKANQEAINLHSTTGEIVYKFLSSCRKKDESTINFSVQVFVCHRIESIKTLYELQRYEVLLIDWQVK